MPSLRFPSQNQGRRQLATPGQEKWLVPSSTCCFPVLFMPLVMNYFFQLLYLNSLIHSLTHSFLHSFMCILQGPVQMPLTPEQSQHSPTPWFPEYIHFSVIAADL